MAVGGLSITADAASSFSPAAAAYAAVPATDTVQPAVAAESTDKAPDRTAQAASMDTVELSDKVRGSKQGTPQQDSAVKASARQVKKQDVLSNKIGDVLFVYNLKGDLRVRFMDSSNKLIYQLPPVMLTKMMDLMQSFGSQVSLKA